mmetsp:Transcript_34474/g.75456  ORF Transcript_34474/g.75456 Transcript_34474/m.75456 type:complete len:413 (+) Transcript_34474:143-1381(+)|eukprot:CAMPEP_0178517312 /NCGR_PEP_ID=MMETSP0696-20121128/25622_1 /TAXON_ID=265572 /ORGANISM="Extubocellulus spinifer, Strain CCMP396" /LENGTH=412 /DNA_ID=CAMNT_0020147731 /DNA_START=49 /DNA_END=1287 /DNA_ORIENTATION=-
MSDRFEHVIGGPNGYSAPCVPSDNYDAGIIDDGVEFVRTSDDAFANLTANGYPWSPNYVDVDGLRMHYVDVSAETENNSGEIVLLLHGQPTWSYLYRKMIPVLSARGYRVIAPDWVGFGRSDKPTDMAQHTYLKQVERLKAFISQVLPEVLEAPTINLFVQDWGSLIGLRTVGDEPDWFKRVVVANGILPVLPPNMNFLPNFNPVNYNCSDTRKPMDMAVERFSNSPCGLDQSCFGIWAEFALTNPTWMPSEIVDLASFQTLSDDELSMYDVSFPSRTSMAAPRAFPSMLAAVYEPEFGNTAAWEVVKNFSRPFLALAGEKDPNLGTVEVQANFYNNVIGANIHDFEHRRYADAGHFIQEDAGEEVAAYVSDFIDGTAGLVGSPSSSGTVTLQHLGLFSVVLPIVLFLMTVC